MTAPNNLAKIMADITAQEQRDAAYRRMFDDDPGYDFVDQLPDELPRFIDLRNGGNLPQWRPSLAVWFVAALSVAAMLGMIWGGAAIIQWGAW